MSMTGWPLDLGVSGEPCEAPTIEEFRARFPEFADLSDAQIQIAIDDASCWVDTTWIATYCHDCTTAMAYLAAHYLALGLIAAAILPETVVGEGGGTVIPGGQVTSLHFESMSVGFSAPQAVGGAAAFAGSGIGDAMGLGATPYGQRFLQLVKVNKPAVLVV